ncbi:MAG: two-component sensor histidine kinase [Zetaproteobacteria bacterium CG_4_10_14_0_2_um_filter_55_20]|nr:MAG: two-component sensor histidine kinase [Zetaproteobacteria bacterium CG1_02_55_237]PIS19520.1 MAG: two-component sensor histidine kinase [Zetaproteobacteria bacterium CG08_land_8_20_14_0_20_55_17]PIY52820.1 MAG: two-component sensor histidine kinase [Zetaproteobacteria bacterium CG_4_10_14_0_8_um_filter_55_43]PIZ38026.1 MAG: two-component sensor histidine kinase [Zetaproteobacteria bacterium CG_4_10_14_0_2_um_filter_55_20]PJB79123.1 MAG: two-component sensor histidine kinase [Zetaproteob
MSLFWKLFFALLLSLSAIATASSWFSQRWLLETRQTDIRLAQLSGYAETAANLYVEEGPDALRRWLRNSMQQQHFRGSLLDSEGHDILNRKLPPGLSALIADAVAQQRALQLVQPPHMLAVVPVTTAQGRYFWVANSRIAPDAMQQNRQYTLIFRLLLGLLAILLVSWLLTRMFTRPIRQLQQSAALLGSGRMDTRAPQGLAARGDELGELARSFDTMARQLEGLMASHKQLLRDVSHELRSPLARLSVALELARNAAGDKAEEELSRIGLEAERLNALIGEVLTLARFEQGAIASEMKLLDLTALLREVAADAAFEAEAAAKLVQTGTLEACQLAGDRLWLGRALDNVVRNAVRHTDEGTAVAIDMRCLKGEVRITVRDHGPGVPDDALANLFEPFFRVEASRSRNSGGYGLGLAIARQVVELHGGSIRASHAPDGGLSVDIGLPLS